jgi:hypothetical protein
MAGKVWRKVHQWALKHFGQPKLGPTDPESIRPTPVDVTIYPVVKDVDIRDVPTKKDVMATINVAKVPGVSRLTPSQLAALADTATELDIPLDWLVTVISFETGGTFSPSVDNKAGSGAFGLIQFMPSTAKALLKTSTEASAVLLGKSMSFEEQLQRMVIPYFAPYRGKLHSLSDLYLAIFYPAAMNKSDDYVVGRAEGPGAAVYRQNKGFDKDGKGYITRADITGRINSLLNNALGIMTLEVSSGKVGSGFLAIGITMLLTALGYAGWVDWNRPNSRIKAGKRRAESFIRVQTARFAPSQSIRKA